MKVTVRFGDGNTKIVLEANPRMRDFESTTKRLVTQAIESALLMGLVRRKSE